MKVFVALPAYTGTVHLGTLRSLFTDLQLLTARGDSWLFHDECGNGLIAQARAQIVSEFLASDADCLVFVDNDVVWERGALLKLVDAPVDMVMGVYPQRKDPVNYCVKWKSGDLWADKDTGLLEIEGGPAGFMKLSRSMLESMIEQYPDTVFVCENAPEGEAWHLFGDYRVGKHLMGEDYAFCARWTAMGGKVWLDPEIKFGHIGYKTFEGHVGDWLRNRSK